MTDFSERWKEIVRAVNRDRVTHEIHGDTASIDLWYPRTEDAISKIQVGLVDVRAADSIRISYDFERDGYVVEQASKFRWPMGDTVCDPDWKEVAFVQAWARKQEDDE